VAVYPAEGTFVFDNPLIALRAPWVTPAQRAAARTFTRWLQAQVTPALAARYGYRPGEAGAKPVAPITTSKYVDPAQPRVRLALPTRDVLAAIKRAWHEDRKAANVAIVVDVSGSMSDHDRLTNAQKGLRVFLQQFSPRDRVGLYTFADGVTEVVPIAPMAQNRGLLRRAVDTLVAGGGTAVYDATESAVQAVDALHDTTRINAVVVLTDGDDTASDQTSAGLIEILRGRSENIEHNVRVFTIAYGGEADAKTLSEISEASGGKEFDGDPSGIAAVYQQISSYF
jgi:Ca-activated chloride channel family protein